MKSDEDIQVARSILMSVAAELTMANGMPPEDPADWNLPKSTPKYVRKWIREEMRLARKNLCRLANELREASDNLRD